MATLDRPADVAPTSPSGVGDPGDPGALPEGPRLTSCFHLVRSIEDQLRFADSKAAFLATINTLLVGPLVYNVPALRQELHHGDLATRTVLIGLGGAYGLLFLASMTLVALTVLPRLGRPRTKRSPSRLFFGRIAREFGDDPGRFVARLSSMSGRDWFDELGVYIVDASQIAAAKHWYARRGTMLTVASVVAWCAVVVAMLGLR